MNNLTTIYAHDNPFAHTSLQVWQHEWPYTWDNSSQERATEQLKDILDHQFSIDSNQNKILNDKFSIGYLLEIKSDRPSISLFETEDDIALIDLDSSMLSFPHEDDEVEKWECYRK
jgi:hypothetical protein